MKRILGLTLVLGTALGVSSWAMEAGKLDIGVHPGFSAPLGSAKDFFKGSFHPDVSAGYQLHEWITGGLELGYSFGHKLEGTSQGQSFTSDVNSKVLNVTPTVKVGKAMEGGGMTWKPYAALGAGLYHRSQDAGTRTTTFGSFPIESDTESSFGANVGAGVTMRVREKWDVGVDVRYHRAFQPKDATGQDQDTEFLIPTVRMSYTF